MVILSQILPTPEVLFCCCAFINSLSYCLLHQSHTKMNNYNNKSKIWINLHLTRATASKASLVRKKTPFCKTVKVVLSMRKFVTETLLPLHDFRTSSFTHVTRCITASCGEGNIFPPAFTPETGNLPVSRHPFGNR